MSYLHILKARAEGREISERDMAAAASRRSDMKLEEDGGQVAIVVSMTGGRSFGIHRAGSEWSAERLADDEIARLVEIADAVGAVVVGDENETYSLAGGLLAEHPAAAETRPNRFMQYMRSTHPVSLALHAAVVVALMAIAAKWMKLA